MHLELSASLFTMLAGATLVVGRAAVQQRFTAARRTLPPARVLLAILVVALAVTVTVQVLAPPIAVSLAHSETLDPVVPRTD